MKLFEIVSLIENASAGSTGSGAVATVAMPLGQVQKRIPDGSLFFAKYTTDATPNTPAEYKKYKRKK